MTHTAALGRLTKSDENHSYHLALSQAGVPATQSNAAFLAMNIHSVHFA